MAENVIKKINDR